MKVCMKSRCGMGLALAFAALAGSEPAPAAQKAPPRLEPAMGTASGKMNPRGTPRLSTRLPRANAMPPLPVRKPASGAKTAMPDVWKPEEIAAAQARCRTILGATDAQALPEPPIKQGPCGTPAPIRLKSLGKNPRVTFEPAALVNCELAGALSSWLGKEVQPLALKHLGARIAKVEVMSDYSCRTSFGRKGHRLSEHAFADALDIGGFVTETGREVRVLETWGETQRDIAAKVEAAKVAAGHKQPQSAAAELKSSAPAGRKPASASMLPARLAALRLGGPPIVDRCTIDGAAELTAASPPEPPPAPRPEALFLRAAHAAGCRIFGTTLGPEANEEHRNHFHLDMAERKYKKICD